MHSGKRVLNSKIWSKSFVHSVETLYRILHTHKYAVTYPRCSKTYELLLENYITPTTRNNNKLVD